MPIIIIDGYISDGFNVAASTPQRRSAPAPAPAPAPVQYDPFWATAQDNPRRFESVKTDIARQDRREKDAKAPKADYPRYRGGGTYIFI